MKKKTKNVEKEEVKVENETSKKEEKIEVKEVDSRDKTNMILKTIVGILAFIIVIGCSFGAGYLGSELAKEEKEDKVEDQDKDKEETAKLTIDSEVVKNLFITFSEIEEATYDSTNHLLDGMYDVNKSRDLTDVDVKKSVVWDVLERENKVVEKKCSELETTHIGQDYFCLDYISSDLIYSDDIDFDLLKEQNKDAETYVVDVEVFKAKYLELFGQKVEFKEETFELNSYPYAKAYYDKTNGVYAVFVGISGSEGTSATHSLDKVEQKDKTLILNTTLTISRLYNYSIVYTFELEEETGNYIFISKDKKELVNENNKLSLDVMEVYTELSSVFYGPLSYYGFNSNEDVSSIDLYNDRLIRLYTVAFNMESADLYEDSEYYYVTYENFKQKYIEFFGSADNLESDLAGLDDSSYVFQNKDKVLYLASYQGKYGSSEFILDKTQYIEKEDVYVISGTYIEYQDDEYGDGSSITGTFELKYKVNNNKNYLVGFTISK